MNSPIRKLFKKLEGKYIQFSQAKNRFLDPRVNATTQILARNELSQIPPMGTNPNFNVLFVSSESDLKYLKQNIQNLKKLYPEIIQITVVTPNPSNEHCKELKSKYEVVIKSDQEVVDSQIFKSVRKFPRSRRNWITQQYIKTRIAFDSALPVLILDADTYILRKFRWILAENSQLLLMNSSDFNFEYNSHFEKVFRTPAPLLNFVTHVQLQFPSILRLIYGDDLVSGWINWLAHGKTKFQGSPVSEYQSYGLFLTKIERLTQNLYIPKHLYLKENNISEFLTKNRDSDELWDLVTLVDP